jgi:hypothetical protein
MEGVCGSILFRPNALDLLEFVTWRWKTPLLYNNYLKDRTDEEHVYTPMPSILDDLALPATLMIS